MRGLLGRFGGLARREADPDAVAESQARMVELLEEARTRPYTSEPVRPWQLLASRVGLWGAVALGAFGGVAGCLSKNDNQPVEAAPAAAEPDKTVVPAQVASVAELVVEEWLLATEEDSERLASLFVEPPELPRRLEDREVSRVQTVTGQLLAEPGYWTVTVEADVVQFVLPEDSGDEDEEVEPVAELVTWYVEVGIVGNPSRGLSALRTPAIVPPPRQVDEGWASTGEDWVQPRPDDELAEMLDGFLDALLAGEGDPGPYLASGVRIPAARPAPLIEVEVEEYAAQELEDGRLRVQVRVTATTPAGEDQPLTYELVTKWNDDRYEVLELWGAATLASSPSEA